MRNDYILDLAESLGKKLGKLVHDAKEDSEPIAIENLTDKDILTLNLKKMISKGEYNEAENLLFSYLNTKNTYNLEDLIIVANWFYNELSLKSDENLNLHNFSRAEIYQGLEDFKNLIV
ncbi:DUF6483 family protein [Clostridium sp. LIBA-8841]|uniref:DUF6483 family protein n=1 Tax=Clostridium sp. LIBA-8841 TaxID=2987530 RepID=UPI002AC645EE|nr:DUF6483 family protein [Clostridium sp. LIBA-8841]MDZ5252118.1 DUF6483 family protein [Clostridium sp. LIBA-8841]